TVPLHGAANELDFRERGRLPAGEISGDIQDLARVVGRRDRLRTMILDLESYAALCIAQREFADYGNRIAKRIDDNETIVIHCNRSREFDQPVWPDDPLSPYVIACRESITIGDAYCDAIDEGRFYWRNVIGPSNAVARPDRSQVR